MRTPGTTGLDCDTEEGCRELARRIEAYWRGQGSQKIMAAPKLKEFQFSNKGHSKYTHHLWGVWSNLAVGLPPDADRPSKIAMGAAPKKGAR